MHCDGQEEKCNYKLQNIIYYFQNTVMKVVNNREPQYITLTTPSLD
jgi:hypothetical protein